MWADLSAVASAVAALWARQPSPPTSLIVATAVIALAAVAYRPLWRLTRNAITIAHEGGHALVAVVCGRRLQSIRLHSDTSGLTLTRGKRRGPGMVFTLLVGYLTPSLLGLAAAVALGAGRIRLTLWIAITLLFLVLIVVRNLYGVLTVLVTGGVVFAISWYASPAAQAAFAYTAVWFALVGGVRPPFELARQRRRGRTPDSDVDQLAALTRVPGGLWLGFHMIATLAALAAGAYLLGLIGWATSLAR